jgi:hypothetical protein
MSILLFHNYVTINKLHNIFEPHLTYYQVKLLSYWECYVNVEVFLYQHREISSEMAPFNLCTQPYNKHLAMQIVMFSCNDNTSEPFISLKHLLLFYMKGKSSHHYKKEDIAVDQCILLVKGIRWNEMSQRTPPPCWRNRYQMPHVDKISRAAGLGSGI